LLLLLLLLLLLPLGLPLPLLLLWLRRLPYHHIWTCCGCYKQAATSKYRTFCFSGRLAFRHLDHG